MERPVREWIEEHSQRLFAAFKISGARNSDMRVTTMRLDAWMVKGLDGITDMLLERAGMDLPVTADHLTNLEQDLGHLERVLANETPAQVETTDASIFDGIRFLVRLIHHRIFEQGVGGLSTSERGKLKEYVQRIRVALVRFNDRRS